MPSPSDKPPYVVPSMAEIDALPWNGKTVATTFAGAGGSSLGYRMAGFHVLYANEFVPAARETYEANKREWTVIDDRDIRIVTPESLLEMAGVERGALDLLDGSPPCSSFSMAGKRSAHWGQTSKYSDTAQRTDDLFYEFARILEGVQPRAFIAENVSGLIKGVAKGYFKAIMRRLGECGYRVECRLLDAQWLGVPQSRQRVILMGVRQDLDATPAYPTPLPYRYSLREALRWEEEDVVVQTGSESREFGRSSTGTLNLDDPAKVVGARGMAAVGATEVAVIDRRVIHDTSGTFSQGDVTDLPVPAITVGVNGMNSGHFKVLDAPITNAEGEVFDPETNERIDLKGTAIGREWARTRAGGSSDRYFQLTRSDDDEPLSTVTALAGSSRGTAGVTASTCRKFTLGELRRLCSFPDDFVLTGSYAQRWERLGRAVPPLMMRAVATCVRDEVLCER